MKRTLIPALTLLLVLSAFSAKAQKNEIYVSYGFASSQEIIESLSGIATPVATLGFANSTSDINYGPIVIGYNHYVNDKWSVGGLYSNTSLNGSISSSGTPPVTAYYQNTYNTVMLRTDYHYLTGHKLQLYSGIAAGVSFTQSKPDKGSTGEKSSATDFAYQLNALGLRYGTDWGIFAELGFGYNGVLSFGISKKF